jgi:hypothetical protein
MAAIMAPKMRTRLAHKLACSALPARCYPRHVVYSLCSFRLCRLRRVVAAGLCELPEDALLLARVRGRRVGRPPRRLLRV